MTTIEKIKKLDIKDIKSILYSLGYTHITKKDTRDQLNNCLLNSIKNSNFHPSELDMYLKKLKNN